MELVAITLLIAALRIAQSRLAVGLKRRTESRIISLSCRRRKLSYWLISQSLLMVVDRLDLGLLCRQHGLRAPQQQRVFALLNPLYVIHQRILPH